jgi:phosphate uptake regulator
MNFSMDTRKIQRTGKTTLTVSLPKEWADLQKASVGDEINMTEQEDGSLVLGLKERKSGEPREVRINTDNMTPSTILRELTRYYLAGYMHITIEQGKPFKQETVSKVFRHVKNLIGAEIVDEGRKRIRMQVFFLVEELSISKTVRRAMNITVVMMKEVLQILKKARHGPLSIAEDREVTIDNLYFLVRRQINLAMKSPSLMRKMELTPSYCLNYSRIIKQVEGIGDMAIDKRRLLAGMDLEKISPEILSKLVELQSTILDAYALALENLGKFDMDASHGVLDKCEAIFKGNEKTFKWMNEHWIKRKTSPEISSSVEAIVKNIYQTLNHTKHIAEIMLDIST